MSPRRDSSQRGSIERRLLVGFGVAAVGAIIFATQLRRSPAPRPTPPPNRMATPTPPPSPPAAIDAGPADVFVWTMPTFSERDDDAAVRRDVPVARGNNRFPASSGDYGIDIANLVRPALPALGRCLAASGAASPADVSFTISAAGEVTQASAAQDAGSSLDACLMTAFRGMAFPSPGTEPRSISFPVSFP